MSFHPSGYSVKEHSFQRHWSEHLHRWPAEWYEGLDEAGQSVLEPACKRQAITASLGPCESAASRSRISQQADPCAQMQASERISGGRIWTRRASCCPGRRLGDGLGTAREGRMRRTWRCPPSCDSGLEPVSEIPGPSPISLTGSNAPANLFDRSCLDLDRSTRIKIGIPSSRTATVTQIKDPLIASFITLSTSCTHLS